MRIEPAMRQAGAVHDRVHADRIDPVAAEQFAGGSKDPLARSCLALPVIRSPVVFRSPVIRCSASLNCMTIVMYLLD